jgi:hypothetical protein
LGPAQIPLIPDAIVLNTQTNKVYIGNQEPIEVELIDGATNAATEVGISEGIISMALNMATNKVYCTTQGAHLPIDGDFACLPSSGLERAGAPGDAGGQAARGWRSCGE